MKFLVYPEPFVPEKEQAIWKFFQSKVDKEGMDFKPLYENWAALMSTHSEITFQPLNRSEGGICTGQSNQTSLQVRTTVLKHSNVLENNSIFLSFQDPDDNDTLKWTPELISHGYKAFAHAIEDEILKTRPSYRNFPMEVRPELEKPLYTTTRDS